MSDPTCVSSARLPTYNSHMEEINAHVTADTDRNGRHHESRSGADNKAALTSEIEAAFTAHGWQVEFVLAGRRDLRSRTEQTVAQAPVAIVVAGGDGTINMVASACVAAQRPLGLVPAGTFNYVARNLGVPTEVSQAVSVIVNEGVRQVDIGKINGRIFLEQRRHWPVRPDARTT